MDQIAGVPSHPLFVHVPVVLLPLAALLAVVLLFKQAWFERYQWVLLGLVGLGAVGAVLAAASGEELEEAGERSSGIAEHAEAGEMARNVSLLFLLVVVAWIVVPKLLRRRAGGSSAGGSSTGGGATPRWFRPVVAAAVVLVGAGSIVTVVDAGHSGAEEVWNEDDDDGRGDEDEDEDEDGAPVLRVIEVVVASDASAS